MQFGKINTMHLHVLPWVDEPLPIDNILLSPDTWAGEGISRLEGHRAARRHVLRALLPGRRRKLRDRSSPRRSKGDLSYDGQYRALPGLRRRPQPRGRRHLRLRPQRDLADEHDEPRRTSTSSTAGSRSRGGPTARSSSAASTSGASASSPTASRTRRGSSSAGTTSSAGAGTRARATSSRTAPSNAVPARQGRRRDAHVHAERVLHAPRRIPLSRVRPRHHGPTRASCRSSSPSAPTAPILFEVSK